MQSTLAALQWPEVLQLVASFARTEGGARAVLATQPEFGPRAYQAFAVTQDLWQFVDRQGTLPLRPLEGLALLHTSTGDWGVTELCRLVAFLRGAEEVRRSLSAGAPGPNLAQLAAKLPNFSGLLSWCEQRLDSEGKILDTTSPALAQARRQREAIRQELHAQLERLVRQFPFASGPYTLRRERYCLPVPVGERSKVPGLVLDASGSGATLYIEPFSLVELNNTLAQTQARIREEEERILAQLKQAFLTRRSQLLAAAEVLATLDAFQARVLFGRWAQGRLLPPGEGATLRVVEARHPLLDPHLAPLREQVLGEGGNRRTIVPTTVEFPPAVRVLLISGPNAGGKTVALKTIGLLVLMAHAGIPVLAGEGTVLPELAGVFCHIGDEQDVLAERSTFQAAMASTAALLARQDRSLLVLYDELGAGTDPEEGQALGAALLEELVARGWWTLATSHLLGLALHVESLPGAANAAMGFDEQSGRPTYRLSLGKPGRSRALRLARTCGLPEPVLARAKSLLSGSYATLDRYLDRLQEELDQLEHARQELARVQAELQQAKREAEAQARAWADKQRKMEATLRAELAKLRQQAEERWQQVVAEVEAARRDGVVLGRKRLAALRSQAVHLNLPTPERAPSSFDPGVGDRVVVDGFPSPGQVLQVLGDRLEVAISGKRVWVERSLCHPAPSRPPQTRLTVEAAPAPQELLLLGLDREEARQRLEKFLDAALCAGTRQVRIVHGHGTGALRQVVWEVLKAHPAVVRMVHPPQFRGGTGVTEAELEG
ncbi:MAG: Smr/MutS family protein [Thermoanaerobaculum sp.]|nr:Smr/MutS family protein [Thermoanaerobaculum sp.]MDW7968525.1 Smr/MutS family protein [Thermoanaerobaculum sp.]